MSWGYVAVGTATTLYGQDQANQANRRAGNAAQRGAEATLAESRAVRNEARTFGTNLQSQVSDLAAMSPQELMAYDRSLQSSMKLVEADSKLLAAIDPALMEASTQALQLLRGEEAASLAPIKNQRDAQRQQLVRTLREQLGPGAETSSAGMKALQQFDMETSSLLGGAQQQSLGQLLGVTQNSRQQMGSNIGTLQNTGTLFGNASNRQANLALGAGTATLGAITGTSQNVIQNAGSPFVSSLISAQGAQGSANQTTQMGSQLLGYGLLSGNKAAS